MRLLAYVVVFAAGSASGKPSDRARAAQAPVDLVWMVAPADPAPTQPRPPEDVKLRALGNSLYKARCASCHGAKGDGRGSEAARLPMPTRDFTKAVYKLRSTPSGTLPTDEDLFRTLTRGMHGTPMLPWVALKENERWALVGRIKAFSPRFRDERQGPVVTVPPPPEDTPALRERGRQLYTLHRCNACHGETGAGNGPGAALYANEPRERAVRMRDFTRGRFIRGAELADLFLSLRTGFDGTPMGAYDSLPPADLWALAAYSRSLVAQHPLPQQPPASDRVEP